MQQRMGTHGAMPAPRGAGPPRVLILSAPMGDGQPYQRFFLAGRGRARRRASVPVRLSRSGLHLPVRAAPARREVQSAPGGLQLPVVRRRGGTALRVGPAERGLVTFVTTFGVRHLWLHPATGNMA